jgi:O-antigen ligase
MVFGLLLVGGLAWAPFWLGSDRLTPWAINAVIFPSLVLFYELSLIIRRAPHPVPIQCIRIPAILFALAAGWALLQEATWTPSAWQHPIWQLASDATGRPVAGSISIDRDLTALALLRLMTAASVLWLALQVGSDMRRARLLLWCVVGIVAVYSAIGLYALTFMPRGIIFDEIIPDHRVASTFVNKNHFATFAGIGLIAAVALTQRLFRRALQQTGDLLQLKIATLIDTVAGRGALPLALSVLILAGLMLSASRGGIASTAVGLLGLFVVNVARSGRFEVKDAVVAVFVMLLAGIAFIGLGDAVVGRIANQGIYDEGRVMAQVITIRSILAAPFLGYGYGTFASAFPMFRDDSVGVWGGWDRLHNTYLEVWQGLGLVFGTMLILSVLLLVFRCVQGALVRERDQTIPTAAVGVSVLVGAHALVDFSLQIQAVTLTYMVVLGLGVAQALQSSQSQAGWRELASSNVATAISKQSRTRHR